jgi:hypothetical protein
MRLTPPWIAFSIALLSLCFAMLARAQLDQLENTTPEQRAKALTEIMKTKLALGPDQATKIAALNLKYAQQMEPVIKGSSGKIMKMMEMRQINEKKEAELQTLLTPDQFAKYQASKEEMREKFEEKLEEKAQSGAH